MTVTNDLFVLTLVAGFLATLLAELALLAILWTCRTLWRWLRKWRIEPGRWPRIVRR